LTNPSSLVCSGGPPETRERWERANRKTNEPWMVNGSMDPEVTILFQPVKNDF
jgi:hypothetical protein